MRHSDANLGTDLNRRPYRSKPSASHRGGRKPGTGQVSGGSYVTPGHTAPSLSNPGRYEGKPQKDRDEAYYQKQDYWSSKYNEAKANGDYTGMHNANDEMNKIRNNYGESAFHASDDIKKVQDQSGDRFSSNGSYIGGGRRPASGGGQLHTDSFSNKPIAGNPIYHNPDTGKDYGSQQEYLQSVQEVAEAKAKAEAERKAEEARKAAEAEAAKKAEDARRAEEERRWMIEEMNRLAREKAVGAIQAAYDKNIAGLDRTRLDIAPHFQDARNQAAAQSVLAQRRFGEYANASGLTSGTNAQAELARQNALQNNLSGLDRREAGALADLDLQRRNTTADYNNAIAQARANGDFQLAQQLYEESVRNDANRRQQAQLDIQNQLARDQFEFMKGQTAWENSAAEQARQDALAQQAWQNRFVQGNTDWEHGFAEDGRQNGLQQQQWQNAFAEQGRLDALAQQGWQNSFNAQNRQDALDQQAWQNGFNEQNRLDALAQQGWQNSFNTNQAQMSQMNKDQSQRYDLAKYLGQMTGDYSMMGDFGYTPEQIAALNNAWAIQNAPAQTSSAGSGGGHGSYVGDLSTPTPQNLPGDLTTPAPQNLPDPINRDSVLNLGLGPMSDEKLSQLVDEGKVEMASDPAGRIAVRWKDGFDRKNYITPTNRFGGYF